MALSSGLLIWNCWWLGWERCSIDESVRERGKEMTNKRAVHS